MQYTDIAEKSNH